MNRRRRKSRSRRTSALALALAGMSLAAGCGRGGGGGAGTGPASQQPVPPGFATFQGPSYHFAYPQDWQRGAKTGALGEAVMSVRSGPYTDGVHCYGFASRTPCR